MHWLKYVRLNKNDTGSCHTSQHQQGPQCGFECLPLCVWDSLTPGFVTRYMIGQQTVNGAAFES